MSSKQYPDQMLINSYPRGEDMEPKFTPCSPQGANERMKSFQQKVNYMILKGQNPLTIPSLKVCQLASHAGKQDSTTNQFSGSAKTIAINCNQKKRVDNIRSKSVRILASKMFFNLVSI